MQKSIIFDLEKMSKDEILYYRIHYALEKVKMIGKKSIFIMGQIRSGKSTTLNWIKDPQSLIGKDEELKPFYSVKTKNGESLAVIDNKYSSVTLVQNMIDTLDNGETVSLIDFPGFQENRTEIQILTCSFVMKSCFTHSKEVKFLLVFSNHGFLETTGHEFITTIKNFVRFFKYKQISNEQKCKLFSSVAILITAVQYQDEAETIGSYLERLKINLINLKDMSTKNAQISEIIVFAEQMITDIINNRRLQLFKEARVGKSPQKSRIIENLNLRQWSYFDLTQIRENHLSFPFAYNFAKMKDNEKKNVVNAILCKFDQFKQLQKALGKMIEDYMKAPLSNGFDFTENYQQLQQIIKNNIIHQDTINNYQQLNPQKQDNDFDSERQQQQQQVEQQEDNQQQEQENQYLNPQLIYKSIKQLFNLAQQCKIDAQREENDKKNYQTYCDYLLEKFFCPTLVLFSKSFAVNPRQKKIFDVISYIFSQYIILFKILSQADKEKIQSKKLELKDIFLIPNILFFHESEMTKKYVHTIINSNNFQSFTNEQLIFFFNLLKQCNKSENQILKNFYRSIFKINYHLGQNYIQQRQYNNSLHHSLQALFNILKHITLQKLSNNQAQASNITQIIEKILFQIYRIYSIINQHQFNPQKLFHPLQNQYSRIHSIFLEYKLSKIIIDYHAKYETENKIFHHYQLALFYQSMNKLKIANQLWDSIQLSKEFSKKIKLRKSIKAKIQQLSKRQLTNDTVQTQNDTQCFDFSNRKNLIDFINKINKEVIKSTLIYKEEQLDMISEQIHKSKLKIQQKSQFCITIPEKLNFFKILKYTQHLINKINNRKVTFLIGESAGKTTAFYWIKGAPLIAARSNQAYSLPNNYQQKNRININEQMPTQIPNFGLYKQDEIIIDLPVLNSKNLFHKMLYYDLLSKMIHKSSAYRFLIIMKHESMKESCPQLIDHIKTLLAIFKDPLLISQQIAILITFAQNDATIQIRKKLMKLSIYLKKQKCDYDEEKDKQKVNQYQIIIRIVEEILKRGKFTYFMRPNINTNISPIKNNEIKILLEQRSFNYQTTSLLNQENKSKLFYPLVLSFNNKENQKLLIYISQHYKQLKENTNKVIKFIRKIFQNIENASPQIPTLQLTYSQQQKRVYLDILMQLQAGVPIQYQYPYQKPSTKDGYSLNLIQQIITIQKRKQLCLQPQYQSNSYKDKISMTYKFIKNLFKLAFQNSQNTFILNCYWLKAYQKLQQFKTIQQIIRQQNTCKEQIYNKYGERLSDITCILNSHQSYSLISLKSLLKYFFSKFSVDKFIIQCKNTIEQSIKRLLTLINQFLQQRIQYRAHLFQQSITKQQIEQFKIIIQKIATHEITNKNTKIIVSLWMIEIQLLSRLQNKNLHDKNKKIIKIIKNICKVLTPINLQIIKQISFQCNIIDIYRQNFNNILQMVSDSTIRKNTLVQSIEYFMEKSLFLEASEKCEAYIQLQIDEAEKQLYQIIKEQADKYIQQKSSDIEKTIRQEIKNFNIASFLKLRQKIINAVSCI